MTAITEIKAAAEQAVEQTLEKGVVEDVRVEPAIGSDGEEILRIMIVLREGAVDSIDGDGFLSTLVSIKKNVRNVGEPRLAIIEYATTAELDDDGDSES